MDGGEENDHAHIGDDAMSSEHTKLDEFESEKDEKTMKRRSGNDGIIALTAQNDAFRPFKGMTVRKFKKVSFDYDTAGGNPVRLALWVSEEAPKHFPQSSTKKHEIHTCEICEKQFKEKRNLQKHLATHEKADPLPQT